MSLFVANLEKKIGKFLSRGYKKPSTFPSGKLEVPLPYQLSANLIYRSHLANIVP